MTKKNLCGSEILVFLQCVHRVWNLREFSSHFFRKNFVKAMVLLKKLLNIWFDEYFFSIERKFLVFSTLVCHTVKITEIYSRHTIRIALIFSVKPMNKSQILPILYSTNIILLRKSDTSNSLQAYCRNKNWTYNFDKSNNFSRLRWLLRANEWRFYNVMCIFRVSGMPINCGSR